MNIKTLLIAGIVSAASAAQAAVVTTESKQGTVYTVSGTDLLQTDSTGFTEDLEWTYDHLGFDPGTPNFLADGDGDLIATPNVHIRNGTITYDLDTASNPLGFEINSIDTYSGHTDTGRTDQEYIVKYSTVNDPGTFITIATIAKNGTDVYEKWAITEDTTGILATGVAKVQFDFYSDDRQQSQGVGYWELDVFGSAVAVPEPSTLALLGAGGVMLLAARVRRFRADAA